MLNCIADNGRLGFAQRAGAGPGAVAPGDSQLFTDGPFLLAGSEVLKLVPDLVAIEVTVEPVKAVPARPKKPQWGVVPTTKPATPEGN
jgi:hypothetical protein